MSLSAAEYREHLETTGRRAGFRFPEIVLPRESAVQLGGLRFS